MVKELSTDLALHSPKLEPIKHLKDVATLTDKEFQFGLDDMAQKLMDIEKELKLGKTQGMSDKELDRVRKDIESHKATIKELGKMQKNLIKRRVHLFSDLLIESNGLCDSFNVPTILESKWEEAYKEVTSPKFKKSMKKNLLKQAESDSYWKTEKDKSPKTFSEWLDSVVDNIPAVIDSIRKEVGKEFVNTMKPFGHMIDKSIVKASTKPKGRTLKTQTMMNNIRTDWTKLESEGFTAKVIQEKLAVKYGLKPSTIKKYNYDISDISDLIVGD